MDDAPAIAAQTDDDLRAEVAAWLKANWDGSVRGGPQGGGDMRAYRAWVAKVVDARWAAPRWPVAWYGRGLSNEQARIVEREFAKVGAPGTGQDRTQLYANTLLARGTDALKAKLIGPILKGEITMCLLYSEPGAGSDLAGVRTRAELKGDHYVVNGQKVWTSTAATADYGMLLARTNWDVPKHQGISFFFLPMKQKGVEVRPLRQITNESHFNEVFFTDAIVPAENLLGEPGQGWSVLQTALAREAGRLSDPLLRQDIARVIAYRRLNALNTARAKADLAQGTSSPVMSLGKLAMSRILHEEARVRTAILGAGSLLEGPEHPRAEDANFLTLNAYFTSIGGGTDQIQRNIIGERVLGLPKEPEVDRDIPFRQVRAG